ncbi:MAG: hypothetical protein ACXWL2_03575 [Candidatus Chromulinivorax sp.]
MKNFQAKRLIAFLLLSTIPFTIFPSFLGTPLTAKKTFKWSGKLVKEVYANAYMTYLNHANVFDRSFYYRTTLDGILLSFFGDNEKNPLVDMKAAIRFRYIAGAPSVFKTLPGSFNIGGVAQTEPALALQKSTLWLRELFLKISLDKNPTESLHYLKIGSFPYELGRGIALGSAYNAGGFLGIDPRFSIDQFAPGALLHTDIIPDTLSGDLYYAVLSNPNVNYKDNTEVIRANQVSDEQNPIKVRGLNCQVWMLSGALFWKAIRNGKTQLDVKPYAYMYVSPDQKLEYPADSDSQLYLIGNALELESGNFGWGVDAAFQGGQTWAKAWDRNYTNLVNSGDATGSICAQYTKVYTDSSLTNLAYVSSENKSVVNAGQQGYLQNGQEIVVDGTPTGLWNATDRYRPNENIFYHGYFVVTDMSYAFLDKQLKLCADVGYTSGHLDDFNEISSLTAAQLEHQNFNGFIPVQSVYTGKRIQHLVMLNTGVPRFTVQDPTVPLEQQQVPSRITGVTTLVNEFTNLAYTGIGLECKPAKLADQKFLIKPVALYYWMAQAPTLADGSPASHALGTALSLEFEATLWQCLEMGGYFGLMIPGKQYKQFAGLQLKGGKLGSDTAYVLNLTMTYKF